MGDSWETEDHSIASSVGGLRLNPNAPSFSFNPSASAFTPSWAPPPQHQQPTSVPQTASPPPVAAPAADEELLDAQDVAAESEMQEAEQATPSGTQQLLPGVYCDISGVCVSQSILLQMPVLSDKGVFASATRR
jgi:hypothetical protein